MNKSDNIKIQVIAHYDALVDENNDPVRDPKPLRDYMDKWDGQSFIDKMKLNSSKSVLEIGVGTGRLARRVAPFCREFCGIDISSKTIERAKENLTEYSNVSLICGDFAEIEFDRNFDVIYSSLTFMHFEDKVRIIAKIADALNNKGRFVLSIDKNQTEFIDMGSRKIKIFPDSPDVIMHAISQAGLVLIECFETEFAHILVSEKS